MDGQAKFYERGPSVGIHPQVTTIPCRQPGQVCGRALAPRALPGLQPLPQSPRARGRRRRSGFAKAARDRLRMEHCKTCNLPMKPSEQDAIRSEFRGRRVGVREVCPDVDASPFCPTCGSGLTCYEKSRPAALRSTTQANGGWICRDCGGFGRGASPTSPKATDFTRAGASRTAALVGVSVRLWPAVSVSPGL